MKKEKGECRAEVVAMNALGRGVSSVHCELGTNGVCVLAQLIDKGFYAEPQKLPCMNGYYGNIPKLPSEN